jgi:hypothetical protein
LNGADALAPLVEPFRNSKACLGRGPESSGSVDEAPWQNGKQESKTRCKQPHA